MDNKQVAFGRVVSDRVAFAYILDVFVLIEHRGLGYATTLLKYILADSELASVPVWQLRTNNAQGLYKRFGFAEVDDPSTILRLARSSSIDAQNEEPTR